MRWLLTFYAAFAGWRIGLAQRDAQHFASAADKWIARQEWAEARLKQLQRRRS